MAFQFQVPGMRRVSCSPGPRGGAVPPDKFNTLNREEAQTHRQIFKLGSQMRKNPSSKVAEIYQ